MINRQYDKIVVVCYPHGAGGNFLINCLSLTDQCVLRHVNLAEDQLINGNSSINKLTYLHDQLEISQKNKKWNDLSLGCLHLFGIKNSLYLLEYPEIIEKKFNRVIHQLIEQEKYLFIVAHTTQYLDAYLKFWSNARVIFLTEYSNFTEKRGYYGSSSKKDKLELTKYWNIIRGPDWPATPPSSDSEFLKLPVDIQTELTNNFQGEIFRWFDYSADREKIHNQIVSTRIDQLGSRGYTWNVATNFSGNEQIFIEELRHCAKWLNMDITTDYSGLVKYYKTWLNVIFNKRDLIQHA